MMLMMIVGGGGDDGDDGDDGGQGSMNLVQRDKIAENQNWSPQFLFKIEF